PAGLLLLEEAVDYGAQWVVAAQAVEDVAPRPDRLDDPRGDQVVLHEATDSSPAEMGRVGQGRDGPLATMAGKLAQDPHRALRREDPAQRVAEVTLGHGRRSHPASLPALYNAFIV